MFFKRDAKYYFNKGKKLYRSDGEKSIAMFDKATELSPDDPELYLKVGGLMFQESGGRKDRLGTALQYLQKATQLMPGNSMAHLIRGNVLMQLEKVDDAIDSYNQAINANHQNAFAHNCRGKALSRKGLFLEAMDDLSKAVFLARGTMYSISFESDLEKFVKERDFSAQVEDTQSSGKRHSQEKASCPRCHKLFQEPRFDIPEKARPDKVFEGRLVAEVMKCKRCGAMYCWPDCCEMEPCICGSQQGFVGALVFLASQ